MEKIITGHNDDCIFCAMKDKYIEALQQENEQLKQFTPKQGECIYDAEQIRLIMQENEVSRLTIEVRDEQVDHLQQQATAMREALMEVRKILKLIDECGGEWESGTACEGLEILDKIDSVSENQKEPTTQCKCQPHDLAYYGCRCGGGEK